MNIKFKELYIENFMSIGDAFFDLSDRGFTLIDGVNNNKDDNAKSNGAGKSSIFEALVWALTGNTIRGNKDVVNYNGNDGALVTVIFTIDHNTYKITRTKEHSKHKNNLFIEINGVDKSGKGIRDTEKLLSEYLPDLTPSLIGSVIILGQGLPQKFSSNTPSGRKEVLEKLFKSDFMIQDLKDRISKRRTELNNEIRAVEDAKLVNDTKIDTLNDKIETDKKRLDELMHIDDTFNANVLDKEIAEISNNIAHSEIDLSQYKIKKEAAYKKYYELKEQKLSIVADIDAEYSIMLSDTQKEISEASATLQYAKMELERVSNIKDICPTCGQKLPDVHKPDISQFVEDFNEAQKNLSLLNEKLSIIKLEIEDKKRIATSQIEELMIETDHENVALAKIINTLEDDIAHDNRILKTKKSELEKILDIQKTRLFEISSLEEAIKNNNSSVIELLDKNKNLNEQESILNERLTIQNKFNTIATRDFRGYLLNDIIVYINSRAKEYCKVVFNTDLINFSLDGNNLLISYNNKEYEALSGGERQKIDLIIQFAIRDMLCKHTSFSSNIIVMDEIFDNLDAFGCQKILDLITTRLYDISSIFIISHHGNELNIPYDNIIKIEKDNSGITKVYT